MSAPDITIRQATQADLPGILALYGDPELDRTETLPLEKAQGALALMASYPSFRQFVAIEGARVVGTYALLIMPNIAHNGAPSALVEQVAVVADRRSNGIGELTMKRAMADAAAAGCYKLALSSNLKREAAHRFYDRLGFERHGFSFLIDPARGGLS